VIRLGFRGLPDGAPHSHPVWYRPRYGCCEPGRPGPMITNVCSAWRRKSLTDDHARLAGSG